MSTPEFDISIDKTGKLTVRVSGVSGAECMKLSDMIAQIVGIEESRKLTTEYYGTPGNVRISTHDQVHTEVQRGR
jgi:hypothetical protein